MRFFSRLFSNKDDAPTVDKDDEIFPVPEAIRQFMIEQHGFDPLKKPPRLSVFCPEEHAHRMKKRRIAEESQKKHKPGQKMTDGTIYLGRYNPVDRSGKSLNKTFNVFAAPENLPKTMTYEDTVKHIAGLKKWHGYDGTNFSSDKEIHIALRNGNYTGGWIIPTREILCGKNFYSAKTTPDNIFAHQDKNSFRGTFKTATNIGSDLPNCYWSSTRAHECPGTFVINLFRGNEGLNGQQDNDYLSCRPVRLVEVKAGGPA